MFKKSFHVLKAWTKTIMNFQKSGLFELEKEAVVYFPVA